jgi:hypothetical protein
MLVYWLMFLLPAVYAMRNTTQNDILLQGMQSARLNFFWLLTSIALTLLIGYRYEVGGDWASYLQHLRYARFLSFSQAVERSDPAYSLLNLLVANMGWGIPGVNVVSGLLFSLGLVMFCRGLPRPWLALAVAMPYMVTVVAMGYTRQSVALGLVMLGLVALTRRANLWFVFWVICAASFHKSAVLLLPIAALAATRNKYWTAVWVGVVTLVAYWLFLEASVDRLYTNYVEAQYSSEGAIIRTGMNLLPACIYIVFFRRFSMLHGEAKLWQWFSIVSIALFVLAITTSATAAVDRLALYMIPLQLVVFSYLPDVLGRRGGKNTGLTSMVVLYYGAVLFVWLNYASHAHSWIPYRFYPLVAWF